MKMFLLCLCFLLKQKKVFTSTEPFPGFPEAILGAFEKQNHTLWVWR